MKTPFLNCSFCSWAPSPVHHHQQPVSSSGEERNRQENLRRRNENGLRRRVRDDWDVKGLKTENPREESSETGSTSRRSFHLKTRLNILVFCPFIQVFNVWVVPSPRWISVSLLTHIRTLAMNTILALALLTMPKNWKKDEKNPLLTRLLFLFTFAEIFATRNQCPSSTHTNPVRHFISF